MTLLEFFSTAAVAGIVSSDLRFFANIRSGAKRSGIEKFPLAFLFFESTFFVMVLVFAVGGVLCVKNNRTGLVDGVARFFLDNIETLPGRIFRPGGDFVAVHFVLRRGVVGRDDEVDISRHERRVTRTEKFFCGSSLRFTLLDGLAAVPVRFSRGARAWIFRSHGGHGVSPVR